MTTRLGAVTIDGRFNGPETSANGGYACGSLARFIEGPAEVTLRLPPPLDRRLAVHEGESGEVELRDGDRLIAEGHPIDPVGVEPPLRPSFDEARAASSRHAGIGVRHPLSDCFVCGPERAKADGLGVSPGPLEADPDVGAAVFVPDRSVAAPDGSVPAEIVWAAIDCPSYTPQLWREDGIALLGRLSAEVLDEVRVGERLVAIGWDLDRDGRKQHTASALMREDGTVVASGRAVWIRLEQD